jgi:hypothetical protein
MKKATTSRFRFFFPQARILKKDEIAKLPSEKLKTAESGGQDGLWLEIVCPDESCIDEDGNITITASGIETLPNEGIFLSLFCPDGSCEVVQSSDLP